MLKLITHSLHRVSRRTGGLEKHDVGCKCRKDVSRRTGGLEICFLLLLLLALVSRRTGGLEI